MYFKRPLYVKNQGVRPKRPLHPWFSNFLILCLNYNTVYKYCKARKRKKWLNMLLFTELFSSYGSHQSRIHSPGLQDIYPASRRGNDQECPHGLPILGEGLLQMPAGRRLSPWKKGNHHPVCKQWVPRNLPCHRRVED